MPKMSEWQNYGGLSVNNNGAAEPVVDGTPRRITAYDTAMPTSAQVTSDTLNNLIKVSDAGDYNVETVISFSGSQNKNYEFELYVNAGATGFKVQRKIGNVSDVGGVGIVGILSLAINDEVSITQRSLDGGTAVTIINSQIKLSRLV